MGGLASIACFFSLIRLSCNKLSKILHCSSFLEIRMASGIWRMLLFQPILPFPSDCLGWGSLKRVLALASDYPRRKIRATYSLINWKLRQSLNCPPANCMLYENRQINKCTLIMPLTLVLFINVIHIKHFSYHVLCKSILAIWLTMWWKSESITLEGNRHWKEYRLWTWGSWIKKG